MIETVETLDHLNDNLIEQLQFNNVVLQEQIALQNEKIDALTTAVQNQSFTMPENASVSVDLTEVLNRLDSLQNHNVLFFNDITDLIIFFVAAVLGAIAVKAFFEGATKW